MTIFGSVLIYSSAQRFLALAFLFGFLASYQRKICLSPGGDAAFQAIHVFDTSLAHRFNDLAGCRASIADGDQSFFRIFFDLVLIGRQIFERNIFGIDNMSARECFGASQVYNHGVGVYQPDSILRLEIGQATGSSLQLGEYQNKKAEDQRADKQRMIARKFQVSVHRSLKGG